MRKTGVYMGEELLLITAIAALKAAITSPCLREQYVVMVQSILQGLI